MNFKVGDRVQWNALQGTVSRINILNVKESCQVTFDDGSSRAFFGEDINQLTLIQ
jgi:hypothetical protein